MADKIHIKMLKTVANIGKEGHIVLASRSQAKNFLIPNGFAKLYDEKEHEKDLEIEQKKSEQIKQLREKKDEIHKKLHGKTLEFHFGSYHSGIHPVQVSEKIESEIGYKIPESMIHFIDKKVFKKVGIYDASIHIDDEGYTKIHIRISHD